MNTEVMPKGTMPNGTGTQRSVQALGAGPLTFDATTPTTCLLWMPRSPCER